MVDDKETIPYIDSSVQKYKKRKKIVKWVVISLLSVVLLVYLGGVIYFSKHFDGDTYINGYDVSYKSIDEVETIFDEEFAGYELTVEYNNATEIVKLGDGGLDYDLVESVPNIKKNQNAFLWPFNLSQEDEFHVEYVAKYDVESLKTYLDSFPCMQSSNMVKSDDAYVRMIDGEVVIIPDVTNTWLNKDMVYASVMEKLDTYENYVNIDENGCYVRADITAESNIIAGIADEAEEFLSISACYDFGDYKFCISRKDLSEIGYIDENGEVQISKTNADMYAREFADKYTTRFSDREFETHDGKTILVYGGYYGWVIDEEQEVAELYPLLCEKKSFTKEPAWTMKGYTMCETNDIGDSYVEIDFLKQTLYVYIDGKVELETPVVTGDTSRGYKTPGGLYCIDNRVYDTQLVGPTWDLHVNMWMGFNGSIGMHDAPWRWEYGGDIYTYNGSHGCVNLPYEAAMKAIAICDVGMPVVGYWGDEPEVIK